MSSIAKEVIGYDINKFIIKEIFDNKENGFIVKSRNANSSKEAIEKIVDIKKF